MGEIIACNPTIFRMGHPALPVSNFMENSIGPKRVQWEIGSVVLYIPWFFLCVHLSYDVIHPQEQIADHIEESVQIASISKCGSP